MRSNIIAVGATVLATSVNLAAAHTYIWGVFVNGIDQGTFRGIRTPAYNGPPPRGYANSPVKDLDSIDMRCNVLGDKQVPHTIKVQPGDNLTLDWHHDNRSASDDIIDYSHHGPAMVYLSPDPPTDNSFVKIWEKGLYETSDKPFGAGKWATTADIKANKGLMHVRIPAGLKAGFYLLRAELVGLHEADASYLKNPRRGIQFYPNCVQLEVVGDGEVALPTDGVSFPGAYKYEDPGIVYDVYCSTETRRTTACTTTYQIPGPTVWSGAWPETTHVSVGPVLGGSSTATRWSSWISKSVVTSATFVDNSPYVVATSTYTASWSTTYNTPAPTAAPSA